MVLAPVKIQPAENNNTFTHIHITHIERVHTSSVESIIYRGWLPCLYVIETCPLCRSSNDRTGDERDEGESASQKRSMELASL